MASTDEREVLSCGGREVAITNPRKVLFPEAGYTKLDLARYYLAVADGALRGAGGRPNVLVRYPNGIGGEFFYQKRAPDVAARRGSRSCRCSFRPAARRKRSCRATPPRWSGWPTWRASSCTRIRCAPTISIIPTSCASISIRCPASSGRRSARSRASSTPRSTISASIGWPKTSGSRGIHVYVRIERRWTFDQVRRAALALAREVERRAPALATSKWWKEERHGVFLDYNQNAKDRTVAGAYSVRPKPDARVSAPLTWDEIGACDPRDFTLRDDAGAVRRGRRSPRRHRRRGRARSTPLLELSERDEREGLGDAPWPPHYRKQAGEPSASRARRKPDRAGGPASTRRRQAR